MDICVYNLNTEGESCFEFSPSPIELLGYAKNNILEAKENIGELPDEYSLQLKKAFYLLNEVQEYLYKN